jgi:hypothetical protein
MTLKLKGIFKLINTTKQLGQIITAQAIFELSVSFSILCLACVCRYRSYLVTPKANSFQDLLNPTAPIRTTMRLKIFII